MNKHQFSLGFAALLLGSSILACNFSTATRGEIDPPSTTLSPPPTAEFQLEAPFGESPYFLEEFSSSLPESWSASPGWNIGAGSLSPNSAGAILEIPGEWQEMRVILNLRVRSGAGSLDFNVSPSGAYRLTFAVDEISLDWMPAEGDPEQLTSAPAELGVGWHVLVLDQDQGVIQVELDGETLLSGLRPDYSPSGSLRLGNSGNGLLEIDRLVVAPPGE